LRPRVFATVIAAVVLLGAPACGGSDDKSSASGGSATSSSQGAKEPVKFGLITKFPVDFFFLMENAAKDWTKSHPGYEVITGRGKAATDDDGEIRLIESMVSQGVKGIAITPTSDAVTPALDKAIAKGVKVILLDNDLPKWSGKSAVVAANNRKGGELAGQWLAGHLKPGDTIAVLEGVEGVPPWTTASRAWSRACRRASRWWARRRPTAPRTRASPRPRTSSPRTRRSRRSTRRAGRRRSAPSRRRPTRAASPATWCWWASTRRLTRADHRGQHGRERRPVPGHDG
jgi:hypothetical protein